MGHETIGLVLHFRIYVLLLEVPIVPPWLYISCFGVNRVFNIIVINSWNAYGSMMYVVQVHNPVVHADQWSCFWWWLYIWFLQVLIPLSLYLKVCKIFGCVGRNGKEKDFVPKLGSKINYECLAQGGLREVRHTLARVIFDTVYPLYLDRDPAPSRKYKWERFFRRWEWICTFIENGYAPLVFYLNSVGRMIRFHTREPLRLNLIICLNADLVIGPHDNSMPLESFRCFIFSQWIIFFCSTTSKIQVVRKDVLECGVAENMANRTRTYYTSIGGKFKQSMARILSVWEFVEVTLQLPIRSVTKQK